jgi:glycosyltransferase involved in cell wall biosynthesis
MEAMMQNTENKPKVSVCVVSYNHEMFIRDCLQSLVDQVTDFPFEVIVGDDKSTDGTRAIIEEFGRNYPAIIKPLLRDTNIGPIPNYFATHRHASGQYVAHMDGDDCALPGKLQRQVERLDAMPDVSILWHRMEFFSDQLRQVHPSPDAPFLETRITRDDLMLYGPFGPHSSTMYRRENFSLRYQEFKAVDYILSVELMGEGCGLMMRDVLGGYRVHAAGMSGGAVANAKNRELLCNCQLDLIGRFPETRPLVALRALVVAAMDLVARRAYFTKSLKVFAACRAVPRFSQLPRLLAYYRYARLPDDFK